MYKTMKKKNRLRVKNDRQKLLMCVLPLIKIFLFSYVPMVGLVVAFQQYKPRTMFFSEWVGFSNFEVIFSNPELGNLLTNAIILNFAYVIAGTIVGALLALFLYEISSKAIVKFSQAIILMPYLLAWPIVGMMTTSLFGINGILTQGLGLFGIKVDFYNRPELWRGIMTVIYTWKAAGMTSLGFYAVLLGTDKAVYEAADIDGAGRYQKMWYISLPNLIPMSLVGFIMACGNIIRSDFSMNFFIIGGNSTLYETVDILESYLYRALMNASNYGNMIALGLFQGVVGLILSLLANYAVSKIDKSSSIF